VRLWREHLDVEPGSAADAKIVDPDGRPPRLKLRRRY
jgi:hypothetical protein